MVSKFDIGQNNEAATPAASRPIGAPRMPHPLIEEMPCPGQSGDFADWLVPAGTASRANCSGCASGGAAFMRMKRCAF